MSVNHDLVSIATKFAECGWDAIDAPAKDWLGTKDDPGKKSALVAAVRRADAECGSCGCEFDPLYKKALELLEAA